MHAVGMPTISEIPAADRPRERLLRNGPEHLSDAELLALLIGSGTRGQNALASAQGLLAEAYGLAAVTRLRPEELRRTAGIGAATAARLAAAFELGRRVRADASPRLRLTTSAAIARVASPRIGHSRREQLLVMITDAKLGLRHVETVASGGLTSASFTTRDTLAAVLRHDGAGLALAHNHPSGDPTPSDVDVETTEVIDTAARTLGLRFLDHVIVAGDRWRSITASR